VDRHRVDADPDPDSNLHITPIQNRIGIKTMLIHMRILHQVLNLLENKRKHFTFIRRNPNLQSSSFFTLQEAKCRDLKYFGQHIDFLKVKNTCADTDPHRPDPDRHALDADPVPDPAK
jgi:hypothetical protein